MAITTDLRHSVRLLGRSPVFTVTSILSLALGIGAATTIFSLTDSLLFEPMAGGPISLGTSGTSERVVGTLVSGNYFDVLGTRPAIGRFFREDEDRVPGERPVVVLSHAMWTKRFNNDPAILDKPLRLNNREFAVIGVAEAGFQASSMIGRRRNTRQRWPFRNPVTVHSQLTPAAAPISPRRSIAKQPGIHRKSATA